MILGFIAFLFCLSDLGNAEGPVGPAGPEMKTSEGETPALLEGEALDPSLGPGGPLDQKLSASAPGPGQEGEAPAPSPAGAGMAEIYFAAGTVSADDQYLYVIFDSILLQYALPTLDLKRKVELDIAVAPITPSISISKDSKYLYVILNGILYQIDAKVLKIEKRIKITP